MDQGCAGGGGGASAAGERRAAAVHPSPRGGDAGRALGAGRHRRRGDPLPRRDRAGGGRRGHRLRHDGGAHLADLAPASRLAGVAAGFDRAGGAARPHRQGPGGARPRRLARPAAGGDPRLESLRARWRLAGAGPEDDRRQTPEAGERHGAAPPRHARHRQPLRGAVPGRGRPPLGDAALGLARHRQSHRHLVHRAGEGRGGAARRRSARSRPRLATGRHRAVRRLRRGGRLGAGVCARQPRADDGSGARRAAARLYRLHRRRGRRRLPPQLRGRRGALRRVRVGHAQGRGARRPRRTRHHPRFHGRAVVYRPRPG